MRLRSVFVGSDRDTFVNHGSTTSHRLIFSRLESAIDREYLQLLAEAYIRWSIEFS